MLRFLGDWEDFSKGTAVVTDQDIFWSAHDICSVSLESNEFGWCLYFAKHSRVTSDTIAMRQYSRKSSAKNAYLKLRAAAHYRGR
jgi:hypothetical protein